MNRVRKDKRSSDKIIRGRVKSKTHKVNIKKQTRSLGWLISAGSWDRRSELKKLKGKDIRKDNNGITMF